VMIAHPQFIYMHRRLLQCILGQWYQLTVAV